MAENFPPNDTTAGLAQGLPEAYEAYGVPGYVAFYSPSPVYAKRAQRLRPEVARDPYPPTMPQARDPRRPTDICRARRVREGGGNNGYKGDIAGFLDALPARDREAWIATELIARLRGRGATSCAGELCVPGVVCA
ncbi:hypothetical protein BV22DRAFT_1030294 [Leucogyrophana mollusca]|uniref:Uncharacterized protein n=1 Tax=Leucogyrophana mollusca TaxID=85980 RepID=A0ACB8BSS7_9AGAM|nr:hypothetical protein BV22DRAFT_1030294 [Leucogyrophana mollusca]